MSSMTTVAPGAAAASSDTGYLPATVDLPAASATRPRPVGPLAEYLLVGGLTPLLYPLSWLLRRTLGFDTADLAVGFSAFYAAYLINDPHFAVTYVLFYKDAFARAFGRAFEPRQRARYVVAGFLAPLGLAAWAVFALITKSAPRLGGMIELMFFLVGWHYVKQGFGVMTVLSARRGVRFSAGERGVLLAHAFAGWAYAWASPAAPQKEVEEKGVVYGGLAHPVWLERATFALLLASAALLFAMLLRKRLREGRLPVLTPLAGMLASIWAWSIYSSADPLVRYVTPALHSIQYLYFVWLWKRNEGFEREGPPHFEVSSRVRMGTVAVTALGLGWLLFHGAPEALDLTFVTRQDRLSDLGPTPYFAALFAFVNLHHYFMDFALWRRENPDTRYLRDPSPA